MKITFDEVQEEVKEIVGLFGGSTNHVPTISSCLRYVAAPLVVYFTFLFVCRFTDVYIEPIWQGVAVFSLLAWFFIARFIYGFSLMFSMLPTGSVEKYKILSILKGKLKIYYFMWLLTILVAGGVSVLTFLNALGLSVITLLSSLVLLGVLNFDISRYQLSGVIGAMAAAKEAIKG